MMVLKGSLVTTIAAVGLLAACTGEGGEGDIHGGESAGDTANATGEDTQPDSDEGKGDSEATNESEGPGTGSYGGSTGASMESSDTTSTTLGGGLADCSFDDALPFDPLGEVLQLESTNKDVCVRLERRDDGPGSMANTQWTLLDVRIGPIGSVAHVDDEASLCWYSSHHNFTDWAHTWTGERHYDVKLRHEGHDGVRTYELHTFAQGPLGNACAPLAEGTEPVGDPIALVPFNP